MKHEAILRKALAAALRALERTVAGGDTPNAEEAAIRAAKTALSQTVEPEKPTIRPRLLRLPPWTAHYSTIKGKEGEIVQTVYTAAGNPVCRVVPCKNARDTEARVLLLSAAPEMLSALSDACGYMRSSGDCPFPACETCRIGALIGRLTTKKRV